MYLYTSKSTKSFLESFKKYNSKIKYLKEADLTEEEKAKTKFRVYRINSNIDLTQREYKYDTMDTGRYLNDEDIVQDKVSFDIEDNVTLYVTKNFSNCSEYAFLITKELDNDIKTIIDVGKNEHVLSHKNINSFRKKYITILNKNYYPIKSINLYSVLKKALIISKEQGSSKLELTLEYEDVLIKRKYLFINSKYLMKDNEHCIMISINPFNKEKNLDIFKYEFDNLEIGKFPLFVKDFFIEIDCYYESNTKNIKEKSVEISAKTKSIKLQTGVYLLLSIDNNVCNKLKKTASKYLIQQTQ